MTKRKYVHCPVCNERLAPIDGDNVATMIAVAEHVSTQRHQDARAIARLLDNTESVPDSRLPESITWETRRVPVVDGWAELPWGQKIQSDADEVEYLVPVESADEPGGESL